MKNKQQHIFRITAVLLGVIIGLAACKRDDYYVDGGRANPRFNGTVLEFLASKPQLDTIAEIVRLAGLEEVFNTHEFTFFAPSDENIKMLIGQVNYQGTDPALKGNNANNQLYNLGLDTIRTLADIDSAIWRKYLERYMFRGKNKLMDYPQIDPELLQTFGGQNYYAYNNTVSKIGVVYHDAVSGDTRLKYMGYRQLHIGYIPNLSEPDNWTLIPIASSDIEPDNGIVHVLDFTQTRFGYVQQEVIDDIIQSKR